MNNQKEFSLHSVCLFAVFLLGNLIITMQNFSLLTAILLPLGCLGLFFAISLFAKKARRFNRYFRIFIYLIFVCFALFIAMSCAKDFVGFAKMQILPECHKCLLSLVFLVVLYFFIKQPHLSALKFALLSFFAVSFILILFFVLSFKDFQAENLIYTNPNAFSVVKNILPLSIPVVYLLSNKSSIGSIKVLSGGFLGAALLTIAFLNAVLIFGKNAISSIHYPYAEAISTVTVGSLFTRMDGFAYFIFFICSLLKSGVCVKCASALLEKSGFKALHFFDISALVLILIFTLL